MAEVKTNFGEAKVQSKNLFFSSVRAKTQPYS